MTRHNVRTGDRLEDNSLVVNAAGEKASVAGDWIAAVGIPSLSAFRPGPGWVVFEREERAEMEGRVFLAAKSAKERRYKPTTAIVRKIGAPMQVGKRGAKVLPQLKVGDRVIINRFCGHDIEIGGRNYVVATEDEVVLVIGPTDRLSEVA